MLVVRLAAFVVGLTLPLACGGDGSTQVGGIGVGTLETATVNADFHTLRTPPLADGEFELLTLSTMPDTVTGGDVLVGIRGLAPEEDFSVTRNGDDVTDSFTRLESGEIRGLVTGLDEGVNTLIANARGRGLLTQPDVYPVMERWLDALGAESEGSRTDQVIAAKPAEAEDRCVIDTTGGRAELPDAIFGPLGIYLPLAIGAPTPDLDLPVRLDVPEDFDSGVGVCSAIFPVTRTPRMVAGMPLSDDVIRCQLKPVDTADYATQPSEETLAELREIFPNGVCDWTKPAAGDVDKSIVWPSIGGETLEPPHGLEWRVARSG